MVEIDFYDCFLLGNREKNEKDSFFQGREVDSRYPSKIRTDLNTARSSDYGIRMKKSYYSVTEMSFIGGKVLYIALSARGRKAHSISEREGHFD